MNEALFAIRIGRGSKKRCMKHRIALRDEIQRILRQLVDESICLLRIDKVGPQALYLGRMTDDIQRQENLAMVMLIDREYMS